MDRQKRNKGRKIHRMKFDGQIIQIMYIDRCLHHNMQNTSTFQIYFMIKS